MLHAPSHFARALHQFEFGSRTAPFVWLSTQAQEYGLNQQRDNFWSRDFVLTLFFQRTFLPRTIVIWGIGFDEREQTKKASIVTLRRQCHEVLNMGGCGLEKATGASSIDTSTERDRTLSPAVQHDERRSDLCKCDKVPPLPSAADPRLDGSRLGTFVMCLTEPGRVQYQSPREGGGWVVVVVVCLRHELPEESVLLGRMRATVVVGQSVNHGNRSTGATHQLTAMVAACNIVTVTATARIIGIDSVVVQHYRKALQVRLASRRRRVRQNESVTQWWQQLERRIVNANDVQKLKSVDVHAQICSKRIEAGRTGCQGRPCCLWATIIHYCERYGRLFFVRAISIGVCRDDDPLSSLIHISMYMDHHAFENLF
jgi:hypothetical protein